MRFSRFLLSAVLFALATVGSFAAAEARPIRVATLLPYVAEALETYPKRVLVVGSVRRAPGAPLPGQAVDLGSSHTPSFDMLAAAKPDVTVIDRRLHSALSARLSSVGGEVLTIDGGSVDSTLDGLLAVGRRVGVGPEMAARVAQVRKEIAAAKLPRPIETLPLFGAPGSFLFVTERTWLGDLLHRLGFTTSLQLEPTGKESFPGYVEVNPEILVAVHPRLALLLVHGEPRPIEEAFRQRFARLLGENSFPVQSLDPALFAGNPGLDLGKAANALREIANRSLKEPRPGKGR